MDVDSRESRKDTENRARRNGVPSEVGRVSLGVTEASWKRHGGVTDRSPIAPERFSDHERTHARSRGVSSRRESARSLSRIGILVANAEGSRRRDTRGTLRWRRNA